MVASKDTARLRLNVSHLNEHKLRHNFNNTIKLMRNCVAATETTIHYPLRYRPYCMVLENLL